MTSFGNTIIALLGAGLGDRAIAQHLGIGLRTIQRRIHDIMSRLNTVTHFQAGLAGGITGVACSRCRGP